MIKIDKVLISNDVIDELFLCDLNKCKGACCVEGDLGAPLEKEELLILDGLTQAIKPYLSRESIEILETEGGYILDEEGDFSTTTIAGRECVFAVYSKHGVVECGIEKLYNDGQTDFKKPLSCHLYPIRVSKLPDYIGLNYDRWGICKSACIKGKTENLRVYQFLKEALIRKFGKEWYDKLEKIIKDT